MSRFILSGNYSKPAGMKLKAGAPEGSLVATDYEVIAFDKDHAEIVSFPPAAGTIRFQEDFDSSHPVVMRVAYRADDAAGWTVKFVKTANRGPTPTDAVTFPAGTVVLSVVRCDPGTGPVGWTVDATTP